MSLQVTSSSDTDVLDLEVEEEQRIAMRWKLIPGQAKETTSAVRDGEETVPPHHKASTSLH